MIDFLFPAALTTGRHAWRLWLPVFLALTQPVVAAAAPAQAGAPSIAQGVAQVVMGILSYSRWPAAPSTVHLCVLGSTFYAGALLTGPPARPGPNVEVRRLGAAAAATLPADCEAVYLGDLAPAQRALVFERIAGRPVVSISEDDPECAVGSMFCLNAQTSHVGFRVNLDAIARSGVRIHPSVLQLARPRSSQ